MLTTVVYTASAIIVLTVAVVWRISIAILRYLQRHVMFFLLHHLHYPIFLQRRWFWSSLTRWRVLWTIIYWSGNLVCGLVNFHDGSAIPDRTGTLAVLNLAPLIGLPNFAQISEYLGVQMPGFRAAHSAVGIAVLVHAVVHIVTQMQHTTFDWQNNTHFWGFLAIVTLGLIFILAIFRTIYYEFVSKAHLLLACFLVASLWMHFSTESLISRNSLLVSVVVFAASYCVRLVRFLWRNVKSGKLSTLNQCHRNEETIKIMLRPGRSWRVQAGEYVYLWMPGLSFWSFLQLHPFMVVWWENGLHGKADQIELLAEIKDGWTRHLARSISYNPFAYLDGPYGVPSDFGDFGSVILYATGAGIASQIPHAKALVEGYARLEVRTRRVILVWQLDREANENWVQAWMQRLLDLDKGSYILRIQLYVLSDFRDGEAERGEKREYGNHDRIQKIYSSPDISSLLKRELLQPHGNVMISVAADGESRDKIRRIVHQYASPRVQLHFPVFQPQNPINFWHRTPRMHPVNH